VIPPSSGPINISGGHQFPSKWVLEDLLPRIERPGHSKVVSSLRIVGDITQLPPTGLHGV
jgi:hypothetical protein